MKWTGTCYPFKLDIFFLLPGLFDLVALCQLRIYMHAEVQSNNRYKALHPMLVILCQLMVNFIADSKPLQQVQGLHDIGVGVPVSWNCGRRCLPCWEPNAITNSFPSLLVLAVIDSTWSPNVSANQNALVICSLNLSQLLLFLAVRKFINVLATVCHHHLILCLPFLHQMFYCLLEDCHCLLITSSVSVTCISSDSIHSWDHHSSVTPPAQIVISPEEAEHFNWRESARFAKLSSTLLLLLLIWRACWQMLLFRQAV